MFLLFGYSKMSLCIYRERDECMYQWESRVRFSETGEDGRMTMVALMNIFQDTTDLHSEAIGVDTEDLAARNRAWLINSWQVFVKRRPGEGEYYTAETRAWKFDRFYGHRNFALYDRAGERLAVANSLWFFVDTKRMRPVRPTQEDIEPYGLDPRLGMDYAASRKIPLPEQMREEETFRVGRDSLDRNHHVNNVAYIRMASDYLPEEYAELRVEYSLAAKLGDRIVLRVGEKPDGWTAVALDREDGKNFAIVEARTEGGRDV